MTTDACFFPKSNLRNWGSSSEGIVHEPQNWAALFSSQELISNHCHSTSTDFFGPVACVSSPALREAWWQRPRPPVWMEAGIGRCRRPDGPLSNGWTTQQSSVFNALLKKVWWFLYKKKHVLDQQNWKTKNFCGVFGLTLKSFRPALWSRGSTSHPPRPGPTSWSQRTKPGVLGNKKWKTWWKNDGSMTVKCFVSSFSS